MLYSHVTLCGEISTGIVLSVQIQADRKIEVLEKENSELKEELEQLKSKCEQLEVLVKIILNENIIWNEYFSPCWQFLIGDRCAMQQVKQIWNILFTFILLLGWAENI